MNEKEQLKAELNHFSGIIYIAYTCLRYAHQMTTTSFDGKTNLLDEHLGFFTKILNRTFYLEIAKIVIDNKDGQNLHKILRKLRPGSSYGSIKFPIEIILELEGILVSQEVVINKIKEIRDREIAHSELSFFQSDKQPLDFTRSTLSFEESVAIFNSAAKIVNTIAQVQFDTNYHMQFTTFMYSRRRFHRLLNDIYDAKKLRADEVLKFQAAYEKREQ
jgi:hypothetical protein